MSANKVLMKFKHQSGDFVFSRSSTCRSSALEELMHPVNNERNCIHAEMVSEQLLEGYRSAVFETDQSRIVSDYRTILERQMYCQYVIVVLIRAGVNLIFKILWKLIVDKKKEYLD